MRLNSRLSVIFLLAVFRAVHAAPADLDIDGVVARHLEAIGGLDKLAAIQSLKISGKMVLGGGQLEAPITTWIKRPNRTRTEVIVTGKPIVQAFDGKTGWTINPMNGSNQPQLMPADQTAGMAETDAIEGPLTQYKEKGHSAELAGIEDVDGVKAYRIRLTRNNGKASTIFLDAKTFLQLKILQQAVQAGQPVETETTLSDFRPVGGVQMPHAQEVKSNGRVVMRRTISEIEVNATIPDQLFVMPPFEQPVIPRVKPGPQ